MIGGVFKSTTAWKLKKLIFFYKNSYLNVSDVIFCKQLLAYSYIPTVHIIRMHYLEDPDPGANIVQKSCPWGGGGAVLHP